MKKPAGTLIPAGMSLGHNKIKNDYKIIIKKITDETVSNSIIIII